MPVPSGPPHRSQIIPRGFPIWPGLIVSLAVGAVLVGVEATGRLPASLLNVAGSLMIAAHMLVVLAAVTLLGQSAALSRWNREIESCRAVPDESSPPLKAIDDARSRLYQRHASSEFRDEIGKTAKLILERWQWTWLLGLSTVFLVPLVGFAMMLWNLRLEQNTFAWREIGLPLILGIAEAAPVLLLSLGVKNAANTAIADWRHFAEQVGVSLRPPGLIPNPTRSNEAKDADTEDDADRTDSQGSDLRGEWGDRNFIHLQPQKEKPRGTSTPDQDRGERTPPPPPPPDPDVGSGWEV